MVFPLVLPTNNPSITFQIWDKDIMSSDDYISAVTLDFSNEAREAFENDTSTKIFDKKTGLKRFSGILNSINNVDNQATNKNVIKAQSDEKFELSLSNVAKDGYVTSIISLIFKLL